MPAPCAPPPPSASTRARCSPRRSAPRRRRVCSRPGWRRSAPRRGPRRCSPRRPPRRPRPRPRPPPEPPTPHESQTAVSTSARFYLRLTPEQLLEYYHGHKQFVRVQTLEGFSIQFRADHLRRWVTRVGIDGVFEIRFDDE
ncbi:MAG: DUF2835 family protein, partial [Deltaproteobacteria bacterium]|nr:DUF2835 family protein [Deltaproteobacteria bacterium]